MNINIITQDLTPNVKPYTIPSIKGLSNVSTLEYSNSSNPDKVYE